MNGVFLFECEHVKDKGWQVTVRDVPSMGHLPFDTLFGLAFQAFTSYSLLTGRVIILNRGISQLLYEPSISVIVYQFS